MSSNKKAKNPVQPLKKVKRLKKFVTVLEVIFGVAVLLLGIITFVPNVKSAIIKGIAGTGFGRTIIEWFGTEAYDNSIFDAHFDNEKLKTNQLKYNYADEYTNFVMFGVDSRYNEIDTSNSDSILIVSIHNTTGEVKMVSVYRDTLWNL